MGVELMVLHQEKSNVQRFYRTSILSRSNLKAHHKLVAENRRAVHGVKQRLSASAAENRRAVHGVKQRLSASAAENRRAVHGVKQRLSASAAENQRAVHGVKQRLSASAAENQRAVHGVKHTHVSRDVAWLTRRKEKYEVNVVFLFCLILSLPRFRNCLMVRNILNFNDIVWCMYVSFRTLQMSLSLNVYIFLDTIIDKKNKKNNHI